MTNVKLTPKQIAIVTDISRLKILTTHQVGELHFAREHEEGRVVSATASGNMMRKLKQAGVVKSMYVPLSSTETQKITRPSVVWFVPPPELRRVCAKLTEQGRASEADHLASVALSMNKDQKFAEQSLRHEVGISDVLIALEKHLAAAPGYELVFAIRTSPRHEDISTKIEIERTRLIENFKTKSKHEKTYRQLTNINPDFFICIRYPNKTYGFLYGEFDNDTSNEAKFFEKLEGYYVYQKRGLFAPIAQLFGERYGLPAMDYAKASFRVLTIAQSNADAVWRRNRLFVRSLPLPTNRFYNFATLADWKRDPLGPVLLNKDIFTPHLEAYRQQQATLTPSAMQKWLDVRLGSLTGDTLAR